MKAKDMLEGTLMFIRFSASAWPAKIRDRRIQEENEESKGMKKGISSTWRNLCNHEMKPIHSGILAFRNFVYSRSETIGKLADCDSKEVWRVMPSKMFDNSTVFMRASLQNIARMEEALCTDEAWLSAIQRDEIAQGSAFNRADYPSLDTLQKSFKLALNHRPFTVAATMFGDIFDEAEADVNDQAEIIAENMMKANVERMKAPLVQLEQGMRNHGVNGGYFKDVTVNQIADLIDIMQGFNITDDDKIKQILNDIKGAFGHFDDKTAKILRDDGAKGNREIVADDAAKIVSKINTYF